MITDYKYRTYRTQLMGCCISDPDEDVVVNESKQNTNTAMKRESSHQGESPSKLTQEDGESLKQKGNDHFKRKEFAQAIEAYKRAISLPSPSAAYFSNLALAYKANGQYEESIQTVDQLVGRPILRTYEHAEFFRKAEIIKARCIIIQVRDYCFSGDYSESQSRQKGAQIRGALSTLKEITSAPNSNQNVQGYLQSGEKILKFLEEEVVPRSKHQSLLHYLRGKFQNVKLEGAIQKYYSSSQDLIGEITQVVQGEMKLALEEPDQFIVDPITYEVFINPVIVPSGQSYDEAILKQHFKNNGYNDPITHEIYKLGEKVAVRNLTLQAYIAEVRRTVNKTDLDFLTY